MQVKVGRFQVKPGRQLQVEGLVEELLVEEKFEQFRAQTERCGTQ